MTDLINLEGITYEFELEDPILAIPIVPLPSVSRPMLFHYGSESGYQRFRYSYFIKNDTVSNDNLLYKYIIMDVKYDPDENYQKHDGYHGKCWIVTINNNENEKMEKYYIRNWVDIVDYFKEKDLNFVMETM
jgi:hypothetical protein